MTEPERPLVSLRPHNLVKVLWEDLLRTEGAIDAECAMYDYTYEFYSRILEVREKLLHNGYGAIMIPGYDELCGACDKKEDFICKLPDNGESNRDFLSGCGLEMEKPYANRELLERIRAYAAGQQDPVAGLKRAFLDSILIGYEANKNNGGIRQ